MSEEPTIAGFAFDFHNSDAPTLPGQNIDLINEADLDYSTFSMPAPHTSYSNTYYGEGLYDEDQETHREEFTTQDEEQIPDWGILPENNLGASPQGEFTRLESLEQDVFDERWFNQEYPLPVVAGTPSELLSTQNQPAAPLTETRYLPETPPSLPFTPSYEMMKPALGYHQAAYHQVDAFPLQGVPLGSDEVPRRLFVRNPSLNNALCQPRVPTFLSGDGNAQFTFEPPSATGLHDHLQPAYLQQVSGTAAGVLTAALQANIPNTADTITSSSQTQTGPESLPAHIQDNGVTCQNTFKCSWADCTAQITRNASLSGNDYQAAVHAHINGHGKSFHSGSDGRWHCKWAGCENNYIDRKGLERHIRSNSHEINPISIRFFCRYCDRSWSRRENRDNHISSEHAQTGNAENILPTTAEGTAVAKKTQHKKRQRTTVVAAEGQPKKRQRTN